MIKHYKHTEIDFEKWDDCLLKSACANVYSTSWYLNSIHPNWEAFISKKNGIYEIIMPLLSHRKWDLGLHPSPVLAQRLGIFSRENVSEKERQKLTVLTKKHFGLFQYAMDDKISLGNREVARNYILPLEKKYQDLYNNYRRDRKSRLQQAKKAGLIYHESNEAIHLLTLFKAHVAPKIPGGVASTTYAAMQQLMLYALTHEQGFIAEMINENKEVVNAAFFLRFQNRIIHLFNAASEVGKTAHANTLLLDAVIAKHAESAMILDMEGSHIEGIADFYKSFGAVEEVYYRYRYASPLISALLSIKKWVNI